MPTEIFRQQWDNGKMVLQGGPGNLILIGQTWRQKQTLVGDTLRLARIRQLVDLAVEIAPGMRIRPRFTLELSVELNPSQLIDYQTFVRNMRLNPLTR